MALADLLMLSFSILPVVVNLGSSRNCFDALSFSNNDGSRKKVILALLLLSGNLRPPPKG